LQEQQPIDMVLTDYCMPEMTGYDLLKAIKVTTHISKALQFFMPFVWLHLRIPCPTPHSLMGVFRR
jgi:CheY-like chemotaxis protein